MPVAIPAPPNCGDLHQWQDWHAQVLSIFADAKQADGPYCGLKAASDLSQLDAEEIRTMPADKLKGIKQFAVLGAVAVGLLILERAQADTPTDPPYSHS